MRIEGYYLNGEISRRSSAHLEIHPTTEMSQSIRIHVDYEDDHHEQVALEYEELEIESRLGNTPREISFGNGQMFITDDNDSVDELIQHYTDSISSTYLHKLESKLTLVILATVISIAIIWSFFVYGIPVAARFIAYELPAFTTEKLGSGINILDKTVFDPSELSAERKDDIRAVMLPYITLHNHLDPEILFRSGMRANAMTLPDGEIVFTDDLVNLAENNEELIAVFFHELGHLKYKHITRRILQDSMITLMALFIIGDVGSIDLVAGVPTVILDLSYSRDFEIEADTFALEEMHKANIPLEHFASIMLRLKNASSNNNPEEDEKSENSHGYDMPDFLSTHPSTEARVRLTEEYIKKYHNE